MSDASGILPPVFIGVGVVVFRGDDVLLVKRGKPPFLGQWSIPGGGLERGERLEACALRELAEETGVTARITALIGVFEALPDETAHESVSRHTVLIDYVAEWIAGEPVAGDDAAAAEFVPYAEALTRVSWDMTREAVARALDLRRAATNSL